MFCNHRVGIITIHFTSASFVLSKGKEISFVPFESYDSKGECELSQIRETKKNERTIVQLWGNIVACKVKFSNLLRSCNTNF